jgi:mycofactocin system transcriptional regulator
VSERKRIGALTAAGAGEAARGRPPSTTREEVSRAAFELFASKGFEATTMDDIAKLLGIGRRTLFRYFDSKNDLVWGDFDWVLERLRTAFAAADPAQPLTRALTEAVVVSNTYPDEQLPELRTRMTLITTVPALQAHSMLRYAEWREEVAQFAALRLGVAATDLAAQVVGYAALAASTAAFSYWVAHPEEDLQQLLRDSYERLGSGYDVPASRPVGRRR